MIRSLFKKRQLQNELAESSDQLDKTVVNETAKMAVNNLTFNSNRLLIADLLNAIVNNDSDITLSDGSILKRTKTGYKLVN